MNEQVASRANSKATLGIRSIDSPFEMKQRLAVSQALSFQIEQQRQEIRDVLEGRDQRLLVILGPCSVHDEEAVLDYAQRIKQINEQVKDRLLLVMRAYVEKPRTSIGWKGFAYDPERNGSGNLALGIERSRSLMLKLAELGLPIANEGLSPLVMQYLDDLISWTAIGARTAESQIHREMVSHLPMPVGIKNSTDGSATNAINAMIAARHSQHTLGTDIEGRLVMLDTPGNPDTHLVLRGGNGITNYDADSIAQALEALAKAQCHQKVLVDCSHANACKQHERQIVIAKEVVAQRVAGNQGILGIMLESYLQPGRQNDTNVPLVYGQSITDPCIGWEQTEQLIMALYSELG